jgi:ferric-dicitrate binding protein FerR (iron transport regulator)
MIAMDNIRIKPAWPKSKDEIWNGVFEPLDERNRKKGFRIPLWGYAASLLIPVLLVCSVYTVTVETAGGEHTDFRLPDHSTVTVNAESKASYKPLIWFISRKVKLKGEACFDVKPGSAFKVQSGRVRVTVLGTAFNVYARTGMYRIDCLSGQVKVRAGENVTVLCPNMQAVFDERQFNVRNNVAPATATGWMHGQFVFVDTPLPEVVAEVERQYNIKVASGYNPDHRYTGNFSKTENSPEEALAIIGNAFGEVKFTVE